MPTVELYCADCLDKLPELADKSVDAIIADLPYGITACKWDSPIPLEPLWEQYKRIIKPKGAVVLFGSQPFTSKLVMSNLEWFKYEWIWEKDRATLHMMARKRPLKAHEHLLVFSDGMPLYYPQKTRGHKPVNVPGRNSKPPRVYARCQTGKGGSTERFPRTVVKFNTPNSAQGVVHPTQKPVALLAYLVRTYTNEGETVLDNTMGSGSTGVACVQTGRDFIGIEIEREYFDIAQERIAEALKQARQPQQMEMTV